MKAAGYLSRTNQARLDRRRAGGFACPTCGESGTAVTDSRPTEAHGGVRRRRVCRCGARFTTIEVEMVTGGTLVGHSRRMAALAKMAAKLSADLAAEAGQAEKVMDVGLDAVAWDGRDD